MIPALSHILTYKSMWALCTLNAKTSRMAASHYVCCLVAGRAPLWAVWTINGRFQGLFDGRAQIEQRYPHLTWRRVMARWALRDDTHSTAAARRESLPREFPTKPDLTLVHSRKETQA